MKASVERLRWGLAAAAVLLLIVVVGSLGYGRYRQLEKWRDTLRHLNLHGPHETTGFTYSSSPKDRTSYKVRAARVVQHGDGTWSMYDVAVTLYSKTSADEDHIYGSDIEYDQNTGVARALGPVHMDLEIGGAIKNGKPAATPQQEEEADEDVIHVQTSGLVYLHKLGVAATDQRTEFRYEGMKCTSRGAEFDANSSQLHLLADVVVDGTLQGAPFVVHAEKADLDRDHNVIVVTHTVGESKGRIVRAATVTAHTRKDGSLLSAEADGGVAFDAGTRHVTAAAYSGTFSAQSLPQTGRLTGHVVATDSAPQRPAHGQADEVDAAFNARGEVSDLTALGHAGVDALERRPGAPELTRAMQGDRIVATLVQAAATKGSRAPASQLKALHVIGSAASWGNSAGAGGSLKTTRVNADDLRALFAAGAKTPQLTQLFGAGHTRLEQSSPLGDKQTSVADNLQASFASNAGGEAGLQIAAAEQDGHVVIHSLPAGKPGAPPPVASDATANRATYEQATDMLTLSGAAHFTQGQTMLNAATIALNQQTQDATASGDVLATLAGKPNAPAEPQLTHVSAARATLQHESQVAEFFCAPGQPARLWQGASQVEAATLLFNQQKKTLAARPEAGGQVHAVFGDNTPRAPAAQAQAAKVQPAKAQADVAPEVVRVTADTMDYDDFRRQADFDGKVLLQSSTAQAQAQHGIAVLNATPTGAAQLGNAAQPGSNAMLGGSLQRVVLTQDVRIEQEGRTGTGTQLVYTAADSMYVLTGAPGRPPHIVDPQQGSVTGASLTFHGPDSTIVVTGGGPQQKSGRVRTEVEVRGK